MEYFRDLLPPSANLPSTDPLQRASTQLNTGDLLFSATRAFQLSMQGDGNLVLYAIDDSTLPVDIRKGQYTKVIWASMTNGKAVDGSGVQMQNDGNLVIYNNHSQPIWNSGTQNHPGAFLRCQDDGNLVVLGADGSVLASSNTYAGAR